MISASAQHLQYGVTKWILNSEFRILFSVGYKVDKENALSPMESETEPHMSIYAQVGGQVCLWFDQVKRKVMPP